MAFRSEHLSREDAGLAFPVVQAACGVADRAAWGAFVESCLARVPGRASGLISLLDEARVICGVLAYVRWYDLEVGPVFRVEIFAAVDALNTLGPARALLRVSEEEARALNCRAIEVRLLTGQALLASRMPALGLEIDRAGRWTKTVGALNSA